MTTVIPVFYLNTASEVLAIPETVPVSDSDQNLEPNSTKVILVSVPSLQEGIDAASRRAVVTLMIGGATLQSRVISSGDRITYSTSLYVQYTPGILGIIYVRQLPGNLLDERRADILQRLNTPDYEVLALPDTGIPEPLPGQPVRKMVQVLDGAMLRIPVREIERQFSSVFSTSGIVIAPSIATFNNFGGNIMSTTFISLSDQAHIVLSSSGASPQAVLAGLPDGALQQADQWQPPIKMTSDGWTVFTVFWIGFALVFLISVGVAYGWYIAQYL